MRARRIDVGDEPVEDVVVVGQHVDAVAAEDRHVAQLLGERMPGAIDGSCAGWNASG
jgi:hypothetical protein